MVGKPIKITDTTLRDAHQSLWATRLKLEEALPVLGKLDEIGYWSLEVWGGATFDVCIRYLMEDPWERLSTIRRHIKKTQLQMLLRGQNIVGYRNYPDDLLEKFIEKASERGIDIFRIFDALNDPRNVEAAIKFVKKYNKHAQGALCYTTSPVHTIEYFVKYAQQLKELGVDSICIKDMAGIITPTVAYNLVRELKNEIKLPIQLHSHASSGMAVASYIKAIEAGVDIIDTAHAPLAFGTSLPAIESVIAMLSDTIYAPKINTRLVEEVTDYFNTVREKKGIKYDRLVDETVVIHQIPGGMASNLIAQLKEQNALDRLDEVLAEVPKVRKDLGYPPLVTPTSQIVGVQAVLNVLSGEPYKIVPNEVKDYVRGLYGRPPVPIKDSLRKKILGREQPIDVRPADLLEPILPKVKDELDPKYIKKEEDILTYALFPEQAIKFFEYREEPSKFEKKENPEEQNMKPEDKTALELIRELVKLISEHNLTELEWKFNNQHIKISREEVKQFSQANQVSTLHEDITKHQVSTPSPLETQIKTESVIPSKKLLEIKSPMVGTFYSRPRPDAAPFVEKNDIVESGATLCIIEAMKLMNEIVAERKCRIVEILAKDGQPVEYGQVLFLVEPVE
ncbi:MAG: acetyl-CoA carboxylase biotin carboxyl carrier protein [candidate division WOR-3 bacterium]|nr:acetyl-CoA carboxylase biotin carboxyl carrier protein [candidate division WOR-3 bacterium]MCX7756761.1 acetyl-CoA carboxylase biotin carboxyl carrier protein [candidate division WOR-3 bacterium]